MKSCDVVVIGAGPYGLSVAAHLKTAGVDFRIFGNPMDLWANHMPRGMHLKSEGFASCLSDPERSFTLEAYCKERGQSYANIGSPVPLDVFTDYGLEFQRRLVPNLEQHLVEAIKREDAGFRIKLSSGEAFHAQRVVVAVGLTYCSHLPKELDGIPNEFVTHSYENEDLTRFEGKEVGILGAGASALDLAALLHRAGVSVHVIARGKTIRFHEPPKTLSPSLIERIRRPFTGIGAGWKLWMCANLPLVFRLMPESFRIEKVRSVLGPAPGWFVKDQVIGKVKFHLESRLEGAEREGDHLKVLLQKSSGQRESLQLSHLVAATGYRTDVRRVTFFDDDILSNLTQVDKSPKLSANFESSVSNLFFVGVAAANTFGPLLRFAVGAEFAAPRIARHLQRTVRQSSLNSRERRDMAAEANVTEPASH
jgi:thioredoxin reductase